MDGAYLGERQKKKPWYILVAIAVIIVIGAGIYFLVNSKKMLVSPVPPEPAFEVIFYTPTPGAVSPTATPSATPKLKKTPTATPKLTPSTKNASPSATVKPTV
jgi:flagellar basal body-associated protein FliL